MSSHPPTTPQTLKSNTNKRCRVSEMICSVCQVTIFKESDKSNQLGGPPLKYTCHVCIIAESINSDDNSNKEINVINEKLCSICLDLKSKDFFSITQWKRSSRKCKPCWKQMKQAKTHTKEKETTTNNSNNNSNKEINEKQCSICLILKSKDFFSITQWKRSSSQTCKPCLEKSQQAKVVKKEKKVKRPSKEEMKQILMRRIQILPKGQTTVKSIHLKYDTYTPITASDEQNMMNKVMERGYYGPFPEFIETQHSLEAYLHSGKTKMDMHQALSLRSAELQRKAKQRHWYLQSHGMKLYMEYVNGTSIVPIAKKIDLPPMNVLRHVLSLMNYSKGTIKRGFKNPQEEFQDREIQEFYAAEAVDCISSSDQDETRKRAEAFELAIESILVQMNVSFVTQQDLEREQLRDFGTPFVTPDFLILDELYVNGERIHWIDAKAFYGSNIKSQILDTARQMNRYIELWGVGSIIFLRGYNENLPRMMDNCVMMDWMTFSESKVISMNCDG